MIHQQAIFDLKTCRLGQATSVWQFASVIRGARLGEHCTVGASAVVDGALVGDRTLIGSGAQLHPGTRVGSDVFVGPGAIFCNDFWPSASKEGFELPQPGGRATIVVEDGASIGAGAIILPGVVIGAGAMVAAGVVCDRPVPAGHILRRDGSIDPMPADGGKPRRMKWAA